MSKPFIIDQDRKRRLGFDEVIYGASKSLELLFKLLKDYFDDNQNVLITKLQTDKATALLKEYPDAFYDNESNVFILYELESQDNISVSEVGVITAGSSDIGVANEAYYTLSYMGIKADLIYDIGVAGIHRLLSRVEELKKYKVLIVVAGFEAALPTVVGGLLPQPIIGVPTSVGYGISKGGETALQGMLMSCANGIMVTNIDNGYGAAMAALRILNLSKNDE